MHADPIRGAFQKWEWKRKKKKQHPDLSLLYPSFLWLTINQIQLEGIPISALSVSFFGHKTGQRPIETGSGGMEKGGHMG